MNERVFHLRVVLDPNEAPLTAEGVRKGVENEMRGGEEFVGMPQVLISAPRHLGITDVEAFQAKFGVPMPSEPAWLEPDAQRFRESFMAEELDEFREACKERDMQKAVDALLDLAYVVYGTALMMGVSPKTWSVGWAEVQRANMSKRRAAHAGESKRGSALDVVKPEGWRGPDHTVTVGCGPWPVVSAEGVTYWPSESEGGLT